MVRFMAALLIQLTTINMPNPPDPRRIVGGSCWAKSTSVSNDSRRIFGVDAGKIWLRGTVLEVLSVRSEGTQRASTLIKARYSLGEVERIKVLNLMQLKKENPVLLRQLLPHQLLLQQLMTNQWLQQDLVKRHQMLHHKRQPLLQEVLPKPVNRQCPMALQYGFLLLQRTIVSGLMVTRNSLLMAPLLAALGS